MVKKFILKLKATIFPRGLVHFIQNIACTPAHLITSLSNEDPGFDTINKAQFLLPDQVIESSHKLSKQNIASIRSELPSALAIGNRECLKRCGLISY